MTAAAPRRRIVAGDGVDLAVTEWGGAGASDRPTVLLVHGYPDTSAVWQPVAELLAARYHVVAYDVRGAGHSTAPEDTEQYRLPHLVADMAAVADAVNPDRPVHLVGHDWGSIQGWDAVSNDQAASRFASFTSLYAPGLDHAAAWAAYRWRHPTPGHLRQLLGQQVRSWYIVAFHLPGAGAAWRAGLGRRWPQIQHRVEKVAPSDSYPAATVAADGAHGVALYRANFWNHLARPHPRPTEVPVQVIVASEDHFVSPAMSEGLEQWVPRLWRTEVTAGHWMPRTHPDLVARYVSEFVDHIEGGPESPRLVRSRARLVPPAAEPAAEPAAQPAAADLRGVHTEDPPRPAGDPHLRGRMVVVTGAGAGIGRATALAFASEGATIVAADLDPDTADRTAAMATTLGAEVHAICPGFVDTGLTTTTRQLGVTPGELDRRRQAVARLYRGRGLDTDQMAAAVLEAVRRGTAVPVGAEAPMGRALSMWWPAATRRLARIDLFPRFNQPAIPATSAMEAT